MRDFYHDKSLIHRPFYEKKFKKKSNQEGWIMYLNSKRHRIPSKCLLFLPVSMNRIILKTQRSPTTENIQKNLP